MLPDIHIGYKNMLNLRVEIVGGSLDGPFVLPDIHIGFRNILHLRILLVDES